MRRLLFLAIALLVAAPMAAAQMPPSITKPIEQARKAADATNAQMAGTTPAQKQAPAAAVQSAQPVRPAPGKGAQAPAAPKADVVQDSTHVAFDREVFAYVVGGRRDPFASPIETGEIRPLIADLRVTGIIFDARGRNSVAVMRDMSTQEQYRVKTGDRLGRARVAQIKPQEVVMTIDEYGFSRQEILKLAVQNSQQTKRSP